MTVSTEVSAISYAGDDLSTAFTVPFRFLADADVQVRRRAADGSVTLLTTGYSLSGAGSATGTCTFSTAPASGTHIVITRAPQILQPGDFTPNDRFPAETTELLHDRQTFISQYLRELIRHAISLPFGDAAVGAGVTLPAAGSRADKYLRFDSAGAPELVTLTTDGPVSPAIIGAALWDISAAESAAGMTSGDLYLRAPWGDVRRYGATLDGVTDDSTAANLAVAQFAEVGGANIVVPAGYTMHLASQWSIARPTTRSGALFLHGAELTTAGAISALKITGGGTPHNFEVYGAKINHRGNADATAGIHVVGSPNVILYSPVIEGHDCAAAYAAILAENSDPADNDTGSFWLRVLNPCIRRRSGADGDNIPYGVRLRGSANAAHILNGNIGSDVGVRIETHTAQTYVANGVVIAFNEFEGFTEAIRYHGDATSTFTGGRIFGNRAEAGDKFLTLTGSTTQPADPVETLGNQIISDVTTYLYNPEGIYVDVGDFSITPDLGVASTRYTRRPLRIIPTSGSNVHAVEAQASGYGYGLALLDNNGNQVSTLGLANNSLGVLTGVGGISQSGTQSKNLRGSATFATAATKAVTFGTAEPDATYFVAISGQANETFWVTAKGTGGFTLNSSNANSTATVDWVLIR